MNQLIEFFSEKGYLVSPDFLKGLPEDFDKEKFLNLLEKYIKTKKDFVILNKEVYEVLLKEEDIFDLNWYEFDNAKVLKEKGKDNKIDSTFLDIINYNKKKSKMDKILIDIKKPELELEVKEEPIKENATH